ncbi:MAG: LysR family transcriptional regulator [Chitinimonas sp.]|nr:LysR family transcriptional regulator [Chitinimonas sp.]
MDNNIPWELYRSFFGVLQEGTLSGAARALGATQPTIGRHIAALEKSLGLVLFTRSQHGLLPTEAAQALRSHAQAMASTAAALQRAAASQGDGLTGVVRVTASDVVGVEVLPPILAELRERHPGIKVELVLSNRVQDLLQREADIAVRMLRPQQDQLLARHIGRITLGLHASPAYLARCGLPSTVEDLAQHSLIGFDQPTPYTRAAAKMLPGMQRERFALRSDSDLAQLALIRAGAGIGFCQLPLAMRDQLVRVLPAAYALELDTWITMHEDLRASRVCKAVFDALVAALTTYAAGAAT